MNFFKRDKKIEDYPAPTARDSHLFALFSLPSSKTKSILIVFLFVLGIFGGWGKVEADDAKVKFINDHLSSGGYAVATYTPNANVWTNASDPKGYVFGLKVYAEDVAQIAANSKNINIHQGTAQQKEIITVSGDTKGSYSYSYNLGNGKSIVVEKTTGASNKVDDLSFSAPDSKIKRVYLIDGNQMRVWDVKDLNSSDNDKFLNYIFDEQNVGINAQTFYESVRGRVFGDTRSVYDIIKENGDIINQFRDGNNPLTDQQKIDLQNKYLGNYNKSIDLATKPPQSIKNDNGLCFDLTIFGTNSTGNHLTLNIPNCFAQLAYYILNIFSWFIGIAGWLLNIVVQYSVVNMKGSLDQISAINTGWTVIRDLINICFIFILLYIAISTILGLSEHGVKHTLAKVIIFGILINFSMFFTKVIIDASNIFTLQFYTKIQTINNQGLGEAMMAAFKAPSIYNATGAGGSSIISEDAARNFAANTEHTLIIFILGILMLITATGVIIGGAWIFFKRFIVFIFLLISSPLAFAGMILPSTEHHVKEWWSKLMAECISAPVFMIILWLVFSIIDKGINNSSAVGDPGLLESLAGVTLGDASSGNVSSLSAAIGANVIFNFVVVTALFSFALIAAQKLGASGGETALKIAGGVKGAFKNAGNWVGRKTIGAGAHNLLEKNKFGTHLLKQMRQSSLGINRVIGRAGVGALRNLSKGYKEDLEVGDEDLKDTLYELRDKPADQAAFLAKMLKGKKRLGGMIYPSNMKNVQHVFEAMDPKQQANLLLHMKDEDEEAHDKLMDRLGGDEKANIASIQRTEPLDYHKQKFNQLLGLKFDEHTGKEVAGAGDHVNFLNFARGLNIKQKSALLGNLSEDQIKKLDEFEITSGVHSNQATNTLRGFVNDIDDPNLHEQIQRDSRASDKVKEIASTAQHAAEARKQVMEETGTLLGAAVAGDTIMSSAQAGVLSKLLDGLKEVDAAAKADLDAAVTAGRDIIAGSSDATALQTILTEYNIKRTKSDKTMIKFHERSGSRWFGKTQDVEDWETGYGSVGGRPANFTPKP